MTAGKKILVFAYSELGHACLKKLMERGTTLAGVYTHEDAASENIWFSSVKRLCMETDVPVSTSDDIRSRAAQEIMKDLKPDLILSFYYRNLIPSSILNLAPLGAYNMHGSLLPKYRGRAPVNWAVLNGEKETGVTLHVMTEKADAGDIIDQERVAIGPDDTASEVQARVNEAAVTVIDRQLDKLLAGEAKRTPQNHALATTFGRRKPEDGRIDWAQPALHIHNLIRAVTHPYPGAFTDIFGEKTYIWRSRLDPSPALACSPGSWRKDKGRLLIYGGDGRAVDILRLQQEGNNEMDGCIFADGLKNQVVP